MAAPTVYTEASLAEFMHIGVLKAVATVLGWSVGAGSYAEAVNEAVLSYFAGTGDIAAATDIRRLRAVARCEAWRAVVEETVSDFDYTADKATYKRSQINDQARRALERAERELAALIIRSGGRSIQNGAAENQASW